MDEESQGASKRRPRPEDMDQFFALVAEGNSLRGACEKMGIDAPSMHRFIDQDDRLSQHYAHARAVRGDEFGHQVAVVALQVLAKKVKPDVGRVVMDGLKWTAGRMAAKRWGDKVAHELSGPGGGPIQTTDLSRLSDEKLAMLEKLLTEAAGGAEEGASQA